MPHRRTFYCSVCGKYCWDEPTYCCLKCRFYLHGSCFETKLLKQIQHFYHPHPLTLCTDVSHTKCHACYCRWYLGQTKIWYYKCKQCIDFEMDIVCTLLPTTIKSESQIHHFLHGHPLSLKNKQDDKEVPVCCVCRKGCTGPTTYTCGRDGFCKNIYFHKSCLELQQQICHPFHPYHPLKLTLHFSRIKKYGNCNACRRSPYDITINQNPYGPIIAYICEDRNCDFLLHAECRVMMPTMIYEGHGHLLQFREDNIENDKLKCSACKSNICESYAFTCLYCDLNLHLLCGPLPYNIKHKYHIHSLFLTNSPVEEEVEDETDEFYCHVCEEERDPLLPIYYCAECYLIAEFKCVFSQIILSLKGEYEDIELRNTLGQAGQLISANSAKEMWQNKFKQIKQRSTLSGILGSSKKDVIEELKIVSMAMKTFTIEEDDHYKDSEYSEDFLFSDEAYTKFMKFLDSGKGIPDPWKDPEEYVKIGDYMVPLRLANILRQLLSRYGDISAKSMLSPMAKLYLFIALCECIYSMTNTRVVDITKDMLLNWWTSLKMLQSARFEIQFAFNHLKKVAQAYFGLYVKKRVDKFDKDLQNLQNKIEALEKKRECIRSAESAKSNLIEECLREATILQRGKASAGLIRIL